MSNVFDTARAPVNESHKFFIANVDFQTTAPQVREFFEHFGNVNQVKLIPHHDKNDPNAPPTKHKGYGFLYMLDIESALAVERYVNAFPENKIQICGRSVYCARHDERRRRGGGGGGYDNSSHYPPSAGYTDDATISSSWGTAAYPNYQPAGQQGAIAGQGYSQQQQQQQQYPSYDQYSAQAYAAATAGGAPPVSYPPQNQQAVPNYSPGYSHQPQQYSQQATSTQQPYAAAQPNAYYQTNPQQQQQQQQPPLLTPNQLYSQQPQTTGQSSQYASSQPPYNANQAYDTSGGYNPSMGGHPSGGRPDLPYGGQQQQQPLYQRGASQNGPILGPTPGGRPSDGPPPGPPEGRGGGPHGGRGGDPRMGRGGGRTGPDINFNLLRDGGMGRGGPMGRGGRGMPPNGMQGGRGAPPPMQGNREGGGKWLRGGGGIPLLGEGGRGVGGRGGGGANRGGRNGREIRRDRPY